MKEFIFAIFILEKETQLIPIDEFITSLNIPIPYKNFENLYNAYKPANVRLEIDKSSQSRRSHQEESFINFTLPKNSLISLVFIFYLVFVK